MRYVHEVVRDAGRHGLSPPVDQLSGLKEVSPQQTKLKRPACQEPPPPSGPCPDKPASLFSAVQRTRQVREPLRRAFP